MENNIIVSPVRVEALAEMLRKLDPDFQAEFQAIYKTFSEEERLRFLDLVIEDADETIKMLRQMPMPERALAMAA